MCWKTDNKKLRPKPEFLEYDETGVALFHFLGALLFGFGLLVGGVLLFLGFAGGVALLFELFFLGLFLVGKLGLHAFAGGVLLWLLATWAHMPLAGWPAGIWRWLV